MISNKVVALALLCWTLVSIDSYMAHRQYNQIPNQCKAFVSSNNVVIFNAMPEGFNAYQINAANALSAELSPTASKQLQQCMASVSNSVNWWNWVFSDAESGTFHYLDLLELLTPDSDFDGFDNARPSPQQ